MAIKPFNSVGGFSVGESPANVILANGDIATSNANLSANLYVINTANVGNLRTDNLLYANGNPWDFQEAAGATRRVQYALTFYNDAATSVIKVRKRWIVRSFRLFGRARMPVLLDLDVQIPHGLEHC